MQTAASSFRPHDFRPLAQSLVAILLLLAPFMLHAQQPHTISVIFFADHPLQDDQWSNLFATIQYDLQRQQAPGTAIASNEPHIDLLRGDRIQQGILVESEISVYLHGDCSHIGEAPTFLHSASPHPGALGWVERTHSEITPFIHIDCSLISHQLRSSALFRSPNREELSTIAIARVFLHEWLHIKTQSPNHTRTGIEKSSFTAADLIGDTPALHLPQQRHTEGPSLPSPIHGK